MWAALVALLAANPVPLPTHVVLSVSACGDATSHEVPLDADTSFTVCREEVVASLACHGTSCGGVLANRSGATLAKLERAPSGAWKVTPLKKNVVVEVLGENTLAPAVRPIRVSLSVDGPRAAQASSLLEPNVEWLAQLPGCNDAVKLTLRSASGLLEIDGLEHRVRAGESLAVYDACHRRLIVKVSAR